MNACHFGGYKGDTMPRQKISGLSWRQCANPRCREDLHRLQSLTWTRLCPSCRLAAAWGSILAGIVAFLVSLAMKWPW